jgi:antitoxin MazE
VIIPKPILTQIGVEVGDDLDLSLDERRIVLSPAEQHPRSGWAAAAKRLAEAGDDALVWPEFGKAGDSDLKW